MDWLTLILSLPTENATARMRAWRTLKACGAAVLRDGVYLMPARAECEATLAGVAQDVTAHSGSAYLMRAAPAMADVELQALFDRAGDYALLLQETDRARAQLDTDTVMDVFKQLRKLKKMQAQIAGIDFFPGEASRQVAHALQTLESDANRVLSPGEPTRNDGEIAVLDATQYQGRLWATRARPWVDRLSSAWLIRRFIDPQARMLWLRTPADCPAQALGFDFDGATFSHVGARVTFETLLASFALQSAGLQQMAGIVHYLDAGGIQPPEAAGLERILAGLRQTHVDDDVLLDEACRVFDALLAGLDR